MGVVCPWHITSSNCHTSLPAPFIHHSLLWRIHIRCAVCRACVCVDCKGVCDMDGRPGSHPSHTHTHTSHGCIPLLRTIAIKFTGKNRHGKTANKNGKAKKRRFTDSDAMALTESETELQRWEKIIPNKEFILTTTLKSTWFGLFQLFSLYSLFFLFSFAVHIRSMWWHFLRLAFNVLYMSARPSTSFVHFGTLEKFFWSSSVDFVICDARNVNSDCDCCVCVPLTHTSRHKHTYTHDGWHKEFVLKIIRV